MLTMTCLISSFENKNMKSFSIINIIFPLCKTRGPDIPLWHSIMGRIPREDSLDPNGRGTKVQWHFEDPQVCKWFSPFFYMCAKIP